REHQGSPWQEKQLFKKGSPDFSSLQLQNVQDSLKNLKPPGIAEDKQRNLYEKVRKYVPEEFQDSICPRPINYETT
ncbi:MAG: hypothetical protein GY795_33560, partial [Desulfobacterales bacterium]|nr:hypothetical protein [Desulfobacterales bacterium]